MSHLIDPGRVETSTSLYDIICWVRDQGEIQAESRLRIRTLPLTVREGIAFAQIGPSTQGSPQLLNAMVREATQVIGKAYPGSAVR